MTGRVEQMIGLCRRAGKVVSGDIAVRKAILSRKAKALVLAQDAAPRSKEKFIKLAKDNNIPVFYYASTIVLGDLLGKAPRAVAAITDEHLARGVARAMEGGDAGLRMS